MALRCRWIGATSTPTRSFRPLAEAGRAHRIRSRLFFSLARDDPDFVLNRPEFAGASILVAGPNFGIGSSREHAVWALRTTAFEP